MAPAVESADRRRAVVVSLAVGAAWSVVGAAILAFRVIVACAYQVFAVVVSLTGHAASPSAHRCCVFWDCSFLPMNSEWCGPKNERRCDCESFDHWCDSKLFLACSVPFRPSRQALRLSLDLRRSFAISG